MVTNWSIRVCDFSLGDATFFMISPIRIVWSSSSSKSADGGSLSLVSCHAKMKHISPVRASSLNTSLDFRDMSAVDGILSTVHNSIVGSQMRLFQVLTVTTFYAKSSMCGRGPSIMQSTIHAMHQER